MSEIEFPSQISGRGVAGQAKGVRGELSSVSIASLISDRTSHATLVDQGVSEVLSKDEQAVKDGGLELSPSSGFCPSCHILRGAVSMCPIRQPKRQPVNQAHSSSAESWDMW